MRKSDYWIAAAICAVIWVGFAVAAFWYLKQAAG